MGRDSAPWNRTSCLQLALGVEMEAAAEIGVELLEALPVVNRKRVGAVRAGMRGGAGVGVNGTRWGLGEVGKHGHAAGRQVAQWQLPVRVARKLATASYFHTQAT